MSDVFDENALMERVDGDVEFLAETLAMLDEESPPLLEQMRLAAVSRDAANLVKAAHALKGMLANFCAEPAVSAARELESLGRAARLDDVELAATRVLQETERLRAALHEFSRTKTR